MPDGDLQITITNETPTLKHVLIFQQSPDLDQLFVQLFPNAWQVFTLAPQREPFQAGGRATLVVPRQTVLGVGPQTQAFTGRVSTAECVNPGERWVISRSPAGRYELEPAGSLEGDTVVCLNQTGAGVSLSLLKNGLPLLTYPQVPPGSAVVLKPDGGFSDVIYLAWYEGIAEGSAVWAAIGAPRAIAVPVAGVKAVDAVLRQQAGMGEPVWTITFAT